MHYRFFVLMMNLYMLLFPIAARTGAFGHNHNAGREVAG